MKLVIAALRDKGAPGKPQVDVPLERRVEYALDCLHVPDEPEHAAEARAFLEKCLPHIDDPDLADRVQKELGQAPEGDEDAKA